jgi:hypothetical protein
MSAFLAFGAGIMEEIFLASLLRMVHNEIDCLVDILSTECAEGVGL